MNKKIVCAIVIALLSGSVYWYVSNNQKTEYRPVKTIVNQEQIKKLTEQERIRTENLFLNAQKMLYKTTLKANHPGVYALAETIPHSFALVALLTEMVVKENWMDNSLTQNELHERLVANIKIAFMHSTHNPLTKEEMDVVADITKLMLTQYPHGLMAMPEVLEKPVMISEVSP